MIYQSGPDIGELETEYVLQAMGDWYKEPYKFVEEFELAFAKYVGRKYALMTPNCTSAIHLLLKVFGVGGHKVMVPDLTWIASAAPISYLGATPQFVDIERDTWCISPGQIEERWTDDVKAIIAVDLYGNLCDWERLRAFSRKKNVPIIEDAAEAVGTFSAGRNGWASVFSFHRTKTITTGEGGMLVCDDEMIYNRCKVYRDHGRGRDSPMYQNEVVGYKYMPFNVQAAIGLAQLKRVDYLVGKKQQILQWYREELSGLQDVVMNTEPRRGKNGAWSSVLWFDPSERKVYKEKLIEACAKQKVPLRPFFYPLSSLNAYGARIDQFRKVNEVAYETHPHGVCLPSALNLTRKDVHTVCDALFVGLREVG